VPRAIVEPLLGVLESGIGLARDVLEDVATQRDVEDLDPPTDAEKRQPSPPGAVDQRNLEMVTPRVHQLDLGMRVLAEQERIGIVPARQKQAVEPIEVGLGTIVVGVREENGEAAGALDRFDVGARDRLRRPLLARRAKRHGPGGESDDG